MPDKILTCVDCRNEFNFTEREQGQYIELVREARPDRYNEPRRCRPCRQVKRQRGHAQGV